MDEHSGEIIMYTIDYYALDKDDLLQVMKNARRILSSEPSATDLNVAAAILSGAQAVYKIRLEHGHFKTDVYEDGVKIGAQG